jgi:CarD family transcriptional regulator
VHGRRSAQTGLALCERQGSTDPPRPSDGDTVASAGAGGADCTLARVNLSVGHVVVYGQYGIGRIVDRKNVVVSGVPRDVVVLELLEGLTVTLPVERAGAQLRPVSGERDVGLARDALRKNPELAADSWLSRRRAVVEKLTAGELVGLAEIVNDGARREQSLKAAGKRTQLSPGEREVYLRARQLLVEEIATARGVDSEAAGGWIEEQLDAG